MTTDSDAIDRLVTGTTSHGTEVRGQLLRLGPHSIAFEIHAPLEPVQVSEVLTDFRIQFQERSIGTGRAVVTSLVNTGAAIVCEVALQESLPELDLLQLIQDPHQRRQGFRELIAQWEKIYRVHPDFKLVVSDIQSFLHELRHWCEQIELGIRSSPAGDRRDLESQAVEEMVPPTTAHLNSLFEKFEKLAGKVAAEALPLHGAFARRHLHPLLLCSPFMHRIFQKPLGYAGDYEMVNMILRSPMEGGSLFAKLLNTWFLSQAPAEAHRNRIKHLTLRFSEEALNARQRGRPLRIYNLGCGPAKEVADFMSQTPLSDLASFSLLDFNDETLTYAQTRLSAAKQAAHRATTLNFVRKSVAQVLKASGRITSDQYDLIYCAGLFDYLPDRVCQQLMNMFYEMLVPGGLVVATNVDACNPIQHIMSLVFEWHLVYRTGQQFRAIAPLKAGSEDCRTIADSTGVNIFLEVRKPPATA